MDTLGSEGIGWVVVLDAAGTVLGAWDDMGDWEACERGRAVTAWTETALLYHPLMSSSPSTIQALVYSTPSPIQMSFSLSSTARLSSGA